jgi:hypothetical protein
LQIKSSKSVEVIRGHSSAWQYGKTIVFLHDLFTARSPSQPTSLRFKILVRKNNVREIRFDMSKAHCSYIMWVQPDVLGLFLASVGSFSANVGLSAIIFSDNLATKLRCYQAERVMFSRRYS